MPAESHLNSGLSTEAAAERLRQEGPNEFPSTKPRTSLMITLEILREPMFLMLIAGGAIYFVLGDIREALMLLSFVFVVIGITFYQERKTERALEALRDLSSPRALVVRDGVQKRIAGREVVRGDTLILTEGDRVPADAVLLSCNDLSVDESLLTGESAPARKIAWDGIMEVGRPGGDNLPFVYSGTLLVQGRGVARVLATAIHTEIGKIGKALETVETEDTPLQRDTRRLVRNLAIVGLSLCSFAVILYGLTRDNWLNGILAGIALAMALLPEEFPVVLTVFLALGAWRISEKRVLTRRVPTLEALGATTVLCVDKTGTLTLNQMRVGRIFAQGEFHDVNYHVPESLPESFHEALEFSILASETDPFDPMERAFQRLGDHYLVHTEHLHSDWILVHEYSLSSELLTLSHVWKSPDREEYVVAAKGAPEAIARLCRFNESQLQELQKSVDLMASDGLRVLGVAKAYFKGAGWPVSQYDFDFEFLGLFGLADPVRPTVPAAIEECRRAGIRVVMITGDYALTAQAIGRQIGLGSEEEIMTGAELERASVSELRQRIQSVNIFARVLPEQKLRLVNAFKANCEIVAMTGDGVNDAPALQSAHVGIAMGGHGTDVAREASSLVLLDDDFAAIVQAVKLGRRIFDNLQKAVAYIFAVHVPIAGISLIPLMAGWPLIFLPVHIVFLELIIDPACSIALEAEAEEADVMNHPPRDPKASLFGVRIVAMGLLQGASVLLTVLAIFALSRYQGRSEAEARVLTFTTLVIANLGLIFVNRSWSRTIAQTLRMPNIPFWWITGGAVLFLVLVIYTPLLADLFRFARPEPVDLGISLAAGVASSLGVEAAKRILTRRRRGTDLIETSA